jgi:hypothetical protein
MIETCGKLVLFIFSTLLICSCGGRADYPSQEESMLLNSVESIEHSSKQIFEKLDIRVEDSIFLKKGNIYFEITFVENYFVLSETNKLIFSYLMSELDTLIHPFDSMFIIYDYVDLSDQKKMLTYSLEGVKRQQTNMNSDNLFKSIVEYSLLNLNSEDIIGFNKMIEDLPKFVPEDFKFKGSFWMLLHNYSLNCCNLESNVVSEMEVLYTASSYPGREWKPDVLARIMEMGTAYCSKNNTNTPN